MLETILPSFLAINLFFLIFLLILNFKKIKLQFKDIKRYSWILLGIILIISIVVRISIPHHFITYYDEFGYLQMAKNIIKTGKAQICYYNGYNSLQCESPNLGKGIEFSFILSIPFLIFGLGKEVAFYTNIFLGSMLSLLIFLVAYLLFKNEKVGLYSAILIGLFPIYVLNSTTLETNTASVFFILLSLVFFLSYLRSNGLKMLILTLSSFIFAIFIRLENILLLLLFLFIYLFFNKNHIDKLKDFRFCSLVAISILLIISCTYLFIFNLLEKPAVIKYFFNEALRQIPKIPEYFNVQFIERLSEDNFYPPIMNLFIFIGLAAGIKNYRKETIFLVVFSLIFFSVVIFSLLFNAPLSIHPEYITQTRFYILPLISFILFGALGIYSIKKIFSDSLKIFRKKLIVIIIPNLILIVLIFLTIFPHLSNIKRSVEVEKLNILYSELEIINALNSELDKNCYLIMEQPIFVGEIDIKTIPTSIALRNNTVKTVLNKTNCLLYFQDLFCTKFYLNETIYQEPMPSFRGSIEEKKIKIINNCDQIHEQFNLIPYLTYKFYLYKQREWKFYPVEFIVYNVSLK